MDLPSADPSFDWGENHCGSEMTASFQPAESGRWQEMYAHFTRGAPLIIKAGLAAAWGRGKIGGRKPFPPDAPQVIFARKPHHPKSVRVFEICKDPANVEDDALPISEYG